MMKTESLKEYCHSHTTASDVQIRLLTATAEYLAFASSVAHQEAYVFTATDDGHMIVFGEGRLLKENELTSGLHLYTCNELSLLCRVLRDAKPLSGLFEIGLGEMAAFEAFPVIDNGGRCIGGIVFLRRLTDSLSSEEHRQYHLLAETAYMAIMVPSREQHELYSPLSYRDGLIIFDSAGTITYANEAAAQIVDLLGFDRRLIGTSVFGGALKLSLVKKAVAGHYGVCFEESYGNLTVEQTLIPVMGRGKRRSILVLRDTTVLRKTEQALLVKNSVIKEIHHRVKNNLQVVAGLLRMDARRSDNPEVKKSLRDAISRIESMALVHDVVSQYEEDYIELRTICEELCRLLIASMVPRDLHIDYEYRGQRILLDSRRAGYVSLLINELVANSIEHGFVEPFVEDGFIPSEAVVQIVATADDESIGIAVNDNGKGFSDDFDVQSSRRLGLRIIRSLVDNELKGTIEFDKSSLGGAGVRIRFEREPAE